MLEPSPNTMTVAFLPLSRQGAGHAIVATTRSAVRLAHRHHRCPRPPLRTSSVPAARRRPVRQGPTHRYSWFRAAGIITDFRTSYNALWAAGRNADALAYRLLCLALKPLMRHLAGDHAYIPHNS